MGSLLITADFSFHSAKLTLRKGEMVGLHKLINHTKIFHLPAGLGTQMLIAVVFGNGYSPGSQET